MTHTKDNRIRNLIIIIALLIFGGVVAVIFTSGSNQNSPSNSQNGKPVLDLEFNNFELGNISMANGIVKKTVDIKNTGDKDLKISRLITSCMCTKVALTVDGSTSQKFGMPGHGPAPIGWSRILKPGESGQLDIFYDPNAHGPDATGPITRTVTIESNSGGKRKAVTSIRFNGNVIK